MTDALIAELTDALVRKIDTLEEALDRIRKVLPFGDTCMVCRGGAGDVICANCGTSGVEPDNTLCHVIQAQFLYFSKKASNV